jgi:hypothetical protein
MTTPVPSDYHDRKTGLVLFGILEIAMGFLCVLAILLMLVGQAVRLQSPNAPPAPLAIAPAVTMYALFAVAFVWLGIGSILARRWARAILLCFSGVGLFGGLVACASMVFLLPHLFDAVAQQSRPPLQPGVLLAVKVFTAVFMCVVYVIIPGAMFLFYRSPHVKRTCEARDPIERWTDLCPPPVLAYSLVMGIGGIVVLGVIGRFHVFPVFGAILSGGAGYSVAVVCGGLLLYLAWGFYRLKLQAWWIALGLQVIGAASGIVTFWRGDLADMYLKMGLEHRTAVMSAHLLAEPAFQWLAALSVLPWLVWLLCIRRYFERPAVPPLL